MTCCSLEHQDRHQDTQYLETGSSWLVKAYFCTVDEVKKHQDKRSSTKTTAAAAAEAAAAAAAATRVKTATTTTTTTTTTIVLTGDH